MKKKFLFLLFGIIITYSYAQQERAEVALFNCAYQSFDDGGKAFKQVILDYEQLLVDENVLEDNSGDSYVKFYETQFVDKNIKPPTKLFKTFVSTLDIPDDTKRRKCNKAVMNDTLNYDFSRLTTFQNIIASNAANDLDIGASAKEIMGVLNAKDFELDFYKIATFVFIQMIDVDSGISRKLPEITEEERYSEEKLKNAIKIKLNEKSDVFIGDKLVDLKNVKSLVIEYMRANIGVGIISLSTKRETSYAKYIAVQNEIIAAINFLRNELSQERYNTTFDQLTEDQAYGIKVIYPMNLTEAID